MQNIDHNAYPARIKNLSFASLLFIIEDCKAALAANPKSSKSGYYADEINYCSMEINRRAKAKKK